MKKSTIITVMIDDITYSEIEELEQIIQDALSHYENKRVNVSIQDTPVLRAG